ncbi:putative aspartate aminotransferase protein [Neofusicoccum parvum UCRNP2]|uniref:Aspartate aminotransferase n=1 Tax=Botryosphaeria parva (strain UCR-NP2) TaxID=1287680 RepID=R1EXF5_BOTPV|nr:putative aspartate aminotransferase protein [Neofusicoccum parvum UCRNP2]
MGSLPIPESRFAHLDDVPMDEAFMIMRDFALDEAPGKISLGAGVYRDDEAKPWVLPSVRKAEQLIVADPTVDHEYQPMTGYAPFVAHAQNLTFGPLTPHLAPRIASVQTISGTGACHMAARFLSDSLRPARIWISDPTWANHTLIFTVSAPNVKQCLYPYYDPATRALDFAGMLSTLSRSAQPGDVVLLHACAHNPTGIDPTPAQWAQLADVCAARQLFPFFDSAYQGFASGDLDADAAAIRLFAERGLELAVAQSFSKNFGLYGQRAGALHVLLARADAQPRALAQLVRLVRGEFSTSPVHGARVVATVLADAALREQWLRDLRSMSARIKDMRARLHAELLKRGTPGSWDHIVNQIGMFSYTGLSAAQVRRLRDDHHIYLMSSGRASIAGLNGGNVVAAAAAIDAVVRAEEGEEVEEA